MTHYIYGKRYLGKSSSAADAKSVYDAIPIEITQMSSSKSYGPVVKLNIRDEEIELTRDKATKLINQLKKCLL